MSAAVQTLRKRVGWTQAKLAAELDKIGGKKRAKGQTTISKWESGIDGPSPIHRMALVKIATKYGHDDLAAIFRGAAGSEKPSLERESGSNSTTA